MSDWDGHGPVDVDEREYGPEWWAMGFEVCTCGHHYDEHVQDPPSFVMPCKHEGCDCRDLRLLALDNQ